jgi:hypothetical protein
MTRRRPEDYKTILVESFRSREPGHRYPVEIRPLSNQAYPATLLVECPMRKRTDFPVGTVFRIRATLKDTPFERPNLYSSYKWPFEVVPRVSESTLIQRLYRRLLKATRTPFPSARKPIDAPSRHGVYLVFNPNGEVAHVGRTVRGGEGLRRRLANHLHGKSSFAREFLASPSELRDGYEFAYLEVSDDRQRALLEAYAVGRLCPLHLGLGESALEKV